MFSFIRNHQTIFQSGYDNDVLPPAMYEDFIKHDFWGIHPRTLPDVRTKDIL